MFNENMQLLKQRSLSNPVENSKITLVHQEWVAMTLHFQKTFLTLCDQMITILS